jgi:hypothetical protein
VVAVAEPTEQRLAELRRLIGEDLVVVVVPKSALHTGLQSELLHDSNAGKSATVVPLMSAPAEEAAMDSEPVFRKAGAEGRYATPIDGVAERGDDVAQGGDIVAALAAQVRGVADSIAALSEYEQRVAELESELSKRKQATKEIQELLGRVVQMLDDSA